ncbi:MAG: Fe-S-containing hydro-lyase [Chitinispirillaceae bacterium]|nr:Fe-S-containing hydro-lyase [Chitinispirillaceae bacterium]
MSQIILQTPLSDILLSSLKIGDHVLLSGVVYTARDAAHKRFIALIDKDEPLPIDLTNQLLYYCGPTPAKPGRPIGSAGPTTSSRMDRYTPKLLDATGLKGMIGKGERSREVVEAIKKHGAVYFAATGGAGALIGSTVKASSVVCYEDLGPEAVYRLEVTNLPLIVAIDSRGNDLFKQGPAAFRNTGQ